MISCAAPAARLATDRKVSRSRIAASMRLRCVMSRAIDEAPTIRSLASRTGETVTETSMRRPFFATRVVSKCSIRSPRLSRSRIPGSSGLSSRGMISEIGCPIASAAAYP